MLLLICAERREWLTERGASSSGEHAAAAAEVHLSGPSKVSTAASGKEEVLFVAGGMNGGRKLLQLSGFDLDESAGVCLFIQCAEERHAHMCIIITSCTCVS